tara:strand:+ start:136 stop:1011 length:876 start_codon:yes stop_codon:yes gene_type:complete
MILKRLEKNGKSVNNFLKSYLNKEKKTALLSPIKYGVLSGGKKVRSSIIISVGKLFGLNLSKLIYLCGAVECIHSYSLIHDDLPCMDNDKTRRGKPSTHVKFGESTAVLAGNSLLTLAFEMITNKNFKVSPLIKIKLIKNLSSYAGHTGIAGGQELDLRYEKQKKNLNQIIDMQIKKTGKLFNFCCYAPALIARKNFQEQKKMSKLGEDIGLLFQLADDFLDVKGSKKNTGKSIKKDEKKGKSTLIKNLGIKKSNKYAKNLQTNILSKLKKHGKKAEELNNIVKFILERKF